MCNPVAAIAVVGLAIEAGSKLIQAEEQNKAHDANARAAKAATRSSIRLLGLRQQQEQQASAQTIYQMDLEARRAEAQARVAAGEGGVSGISIDAMVADIERQRLLNNANVKTNLKAVETQIDADRDGAYATGQSRMHAVPMANPYAVGLSIGGSAANAASRYYGSLPAGTNVMDGSGGTPNMGGK